MSATEFYARVYVDGQRVAEARDLPLACAQRADMPGGLSVLLLKESDEADLTYLAEQFGLHTMAVEDALEAHQRAKFDRYGDTSFVALRPARYLDEPETIEFAELHLFVGSDFVIAVTHGDAAHVHPILDRLDAEPWIASRGGLGVLYAALDSVVDGYAPVLEGLENDLDEIADQVFAGDPGVTRRIYQLSREALALQRAVHPLHNVLHQAGYVVDSHLDSDPTNDLSDDLRAGLADVWDHITTTAERVDAIRGALADVLQANATLVALEQNSRLEKLSESQFTQNEQVKKISAWAAILIVPTLLAGIWGMNFDHMPELRWLYGYPLALLTMLVASGALWGVFRKVGWL